MFSNDENELYDVKYIDGKPHRIKVDPFKDVKDAIKPEEVDNELDNEKRTLYAGLPQAEIKKDKSQIARELNSTLESMNSFLSRNEDNSIYTITKNGWAFEWNLDEGSLKSIHKPDNGYNLQYKSSKLKNKTKETEELVEKLILEHIKRTKQTF